MVQQAAHGSSVSPAAAQKWGAEFGSHPVGTGPYKLQEFTPGVQAVLVRNEDFAGSLTVIAHYLQRARLRENGS